MRESHRCFLNFSSFFLARRLSIFFLVISNIPPHTLLSRKFHNPNSRDNYLYIYIYIFVVLLSPNQRLRNVNEMIIIIIITFGWRQGSRDNDDNNKRITNASLEDVSPRFSHRCKRCGHFPRLAEHNGGFRMAPRLPSYSSL